MAVDSIGSANLIDTVAGRSIDGKAPTCPDVRQLKVDRAGSDEGFGEDICPGFGRTPEIVVCIRKICQWRRTSVKKVGPST